MSFTVSQQLRQAHTSSGTLQYVIQAEVTDAGDLPDTGLFVMTVNDREDPKADTFARVATVADLGPTSSSGLSTDRPTALLLIPEPDTAYYRTNRATFVYADLPTAVAAEDVLKSRLDELVTAWQTYDTKFVADGVLAPVDVTDHPRYRQDAFTALVQAYVTAGKTEATAKTTLDTAKATYDSAVADATTAQTAVTHAHAAYDDPTTGCLVAASGIDAYVAAWGTTFLNAANALYAAYAAMSGADPNVEAAYIGQRTAALAITVPDCTTYCGARKTDLTNAQAAKTAADNAVAVARTTYEDAKAAYAAAQSATEAALTAVRSLKPTFDPATDIPANIT
jgi:hypothetical protein